MDFDDLFDRAKRLRHVFPGLRSSLSAAQDLQQGLALLLAPEDESPGISTRRMTFERLCRHRPHTKTTLEDRAIRERKKQAVEALVLKWRDQKKWRHGGRKMTPAEKDDMWAYVDELRSLPEDRRPSYFDCGRIVELPDGACRTGYLRWCAGKTKTVVERAEDLHAELLNLGDDNYNNIFSQAGEEHCDGSRVPGRDMPRPDYYYEAVDEFKQTEEGKKLEAEIEHNERLKIKLIDKAAENHIDLGHWPNPHEWKLLDDELYPNIARSAFTHQKGIRAGYRTVLREKVEEAQSTLAQIKSSSEDDRPPLRRSTSTGSSSPDTSFDLEVRTNNDDTSSQPRMSTPDTDKSKEPTSTNKKRGADDMNEGNSGAGKLIEDEPSSVSVSSASSISSDSGEDEAPRPKKKKKQSKRESKGEHFNWTADGGLIWRTNVIIPKSKLLEWLPKNDFSHNDSRREEVSLAQMDEYEERIKQNAGKSKWLRVPENLTIELLDMVFNTNLYRKEHRHVIAGVGNVGEGLILTMRSRMGKALEAFEERQAETSQAAKETKDGE